MHLNHFLPRAPAGGPGAGPLRRVLRALGPTWEAAPLRRLVQIVALALFLFLFFHVMWPYGSKDYAALRESKELVPAETFLALDPLVSLSTALAARAWVGSLVWAAALLAACLLIPRGFCGYLCPLGTIIDLFDWVLGRRVARRPAVRDGWWGRLRYYVLAAVMAAAAMGVLVSGFVAALPVLVRGMAFAASPLQSGLSKGWYLVPPVGAGEVVSIALFVAVLGLGLAVIDKEACLPYIGGEGACRLCHDECKAAGYDAIEFVRINVETDVDGKPIEGTGTLIPVVVAEKCVGCGLCQTRCHKINVVTKQALDATAIRIEAGPGKEDRLMTGSYVALREEERRRRAERGKPAPGGDTYLPEFLK